MKKNIFLGFIAILALIALAFTACSTDSDEPKLVGNVGNVPIYLDGVSEGDATTAIAHIDTIYNALDTSSKNKWADGRISRINIVSGSAATQSGTVFNIGKDATLATIAGLLGPLVTQLQLDNTIRLAQVVMPNKLFV